MSAARWPCLLLLGLSGCAAGDRALASRGEYHAYRTTRTADTELERLAAAAHYLRAYPRGHFWREVSDWYARAETGYFQQAYDRPSQLRAYLRALPEGPHAKDAEARLDEVLLLRQREGRRDREERRRFTRIESSLSRAEQQRKSFVNDVVGLAELLASTRSFGQPTSALSDALIFAFRLRPPVGRCEVDHCQKSWEIPYAVPEAGALGERRAKLRLEFELDGGALQAVVVSGPELFSRLAEGIDRQAVLADDWQLRTEAIGRAVQALENAIEAALPAASCRRDPVAPWVIWRSCQNVSFRARAATETGEFDRFEIRSAP